jgi:peptide/nickel transport system permease protein
MCWKVLQGDLGDSVGTARPVLEDMARVFPATLELATLGIIIGVLVGVPMGVIAAARQGTLDRPGDPRARADRLRDPGLLAGAGGAPVFYAKLGWVAGRGGSTSSIDGHRAGDRAPADRQPASRGMGRSATRFSHIVLPAAILGYFSLAYISRMTRSFMLEQLGQEYITTARVKGHARWRVIWVHALRNDPGAADHGDRAESYAGLLEGSVLTETVFAWPGLGST